MSASHPDDVIIADEARLSGLERIVWLRSAAKARRGRIRPHASTATLLGTTSATVRTKLCSARRKVALLYERETGDYEEQPGEGYMEAGRDLLTCVRNGILEEKEILDRDGHPCGVVLAAAERGERLLPSAAVVSVEDCAKLIEAADRRRGR